LSPTTSLSSDTLDTAIEIADTLANQPADSSLSFMLDENGHQAAQEALDIFDENYPSNYTNLKATVMELFTMFSAAPPQTPLNVHLEEDDIKAMQYAVEVLERERE